MLKEDPERLRGLSPGLFERFVAERLDRMGYDVTLTGETTRKDGGIDLIAVPKIRTAGAYLLAAQVKHHEGGQKTGRDAVDRLLAWKGRYFHLGMLVTNTDFTKDAYWAAMLHGDKEFLRLRNLDDLKRWLQDKFTDEQDWREMPDEIELAPGVKIPVPKPRLTTPLKDWPMPVLRDPCDPT